MKYFKNTELANIYNISEKSVRNWIEAARAQKLDLLLHETNGKYFIANTTKNNTVIEGLVEKGKKYRNTRGLKTVRPVRLFYDVYNQKQIQDIISNLTIHREIPTRYIYADDGAKYWDEYAKRLLGEGTSNIMTESIDLIDLNSGYFDELLASAKKVNVVDLGPGNGLPVRPTLERLKKQGRLNRYIAIDYSRDILSILEKNIKEWFGGEIKYEGYVRDFSNDRFNDLIASDCDDEVANMVFLLGGTPNNFRTPNYALQTINESMGVNDILIYSGYLDTPRTRRYFDFNTSKTNQKLQSEHIISLLGIDQSLYDVEQVFNEERHERSISLRPKADLIIEIKTPSCVREVEIRKSDSILLWRHIHRSIIETSSLFDQTGFDIMQVIKSPDRQYILAITKIKID